MIDCSVGMHCQKWCITPLQDSACVKHLYGHKHGIFEYEGFTCWACLWDLNNMNNLFHCHSEKEICEALISDELGADIVCMNLSWA